MSVSSDLPTGSTVDLTVPPVNAIHDLHGDPLTTGLVLFMNGNQFMVMDDLVEAFRAAHPEVGDVFFETIPPGKLVEQTRVGSLAVGSLRLSVRPDVVAAGPRMLRPLRDAGVIDDHIVYAHNDLAILVAGGNPKGIEGLADLAEPGIRVAMPNLEFEGVAELIAGALEKAGGQALRDAVLREKVERGETRWTSIHHRESALWLAAGEVDVCPLWSTEARYHCVVRGANMDTVPIPPEHNVVGQYGAAKVRGCAHPEAAEAFLDFLRGPGGQAVYERYGFAH